MGSFVTSYGNNGKMNAAAIGTAKSGNVRTEVRAKVYGRLSGRDVKDRWCGESSHDGARETG